MITPVLQVYMNMIFKQMNNDLNQNTKQHGMVDLNTWTLRVCAILHLDTTLLQVNQQDCFIDDSWYTFFNQGHEG